MKRHQRAWLGVGLLLLTACESSKPRDGSAATNSTAPTTGTPTVVTPSAAKSAAEPNAKPVPSNVPETIEGANLTMGSSEVDGLTAKKLSCKSGGGMFASMAILGALSKQKAALDECVKSKESVHVHFVFEGQKTTDVRLAGASGAKAARCVADILTATKFPDKGACVMTLELGAK